MLKFQLFNLIKLQMKGSQKSSDSDDDHPKNQQDSHLRPQNKLDFKTERNFVQARYAHTKLKSQIQILQTSNIPHQQRNNSHKNSKRKGNPSIYKQQKSRKMINKNTRQQLDDSDIIQYQQSLIKWNSNQHILNDPNADKGSIFNFIEPNSYDFDNMDNFNVENIHKSKYPIIIEPNSYDSDNMDNFNVENIHKPKSINKQNPQSPKHIKGDPNLKNFQKRLLFNKPNSQIFKQRNSIWYSKDDSNRFPYSPVGSHHQDLYGNQLESEVDQPNVQQNEQNPRQKTNWQGKKYNFTYKISQFQKHHQIILKRQKKRSQKQKGLTPEQKRAKHFFTKQNEKQRMENLPFYCTQADARKFDGMCKLQINENIIDGTMKVIIYQYPTISNKLKYNNIYWSKIKQNKHEIELFINFFGEDQKEYKKWKQNQIEQLSKHWIIKIAIALGQAVVDQKINFPCKKQIQNMYQYIKENKSFMMSKFFFIAVAAYFKNLQHKDLLKLWQQKFEKKMNQNKYKKSTKGKLKFNKQYQQEQLSETKIQSIKKALKTIFYICRHQFLDFKENNIFLKGNNLNDDSNISVLAFLMTKLKLNPPNQ